MKYKRWKLLHFLAFQDSYQTAVHRDYIQELITSECFQRVFRKFCVLQWCIILCTGIAKTKGQESNGQDQIGWIRMYDLKLLLGYLPLCIFISPALGPGILYRLNKFLMNEWMHKSHWLYDIETVLILEIPGITVKVFRATSLFLILYLEWRCFYKPLKLWIAAAGNVAAQV